MEQEFHPVEVKREPPEDYLLILPPTKHDEGSRADGEITPQQRLIEGSQEDSPSLVGIAIEVEIEEERVKVKKEPSAEFVFILPAAKDASPPAPQQAEDVNPKRGRPEKKAANSAKVLKCHECSYQTKVKSNLKQHEGTHSKSNRCDTCQKDFSSNQGLKRHQMQHKHGIFAAAPEEAFNCDKCGKSFSTHNHLQQHEIAVHDDNENECEVCNKICKNLKMWRNHSRSHVKIECPVCQKIVSKYEMPRHMRMHSADKSFVCDNCDYSAKTKEMLERHIERMHLLRKLVDDSLHRDDFGEFELLEKLQLKHGSSATTSEKNFKCEKCGKSFATPTVLKNHKKQVHSEKAFECGVCLKAFKTKSQLNQHTAGVHSRVSCSICKKKVAQRKLKSHMKLHLRGFFECDFCALKSKKKGWLTSHIYKRHRECASKAKKRSPRSAEK